METANFGSVLREARERRAISLADVARQTKLSKASLELLEEGRLEDLPPDVFVRGFIRSYARSVGLRESEPLGLFEQALDARRRAEETLLMTPSLPANDTVMPGDEEATPRRGLGLAVFVIIVLVLATITLSLFLRQPAPSGEGLSLGGSRQSTVHSRQSRCFRIRIRIRGLDSCRLSTVDCRLAPTQIRFIGSLLEPRRSNTS
jgi:cytoskeletal protein RodZ